jgi:hypothetical protein
MSTLDEVLEYRQRVERSQRNVAMAEGALKRSMSDLSEQFGCKTVQAGRNKLKVLTRKRKEAEREAEKKLEAFTEKWKEHLK